ncbi:hypothetical protein BY996DRAFT_4582130 [Phakopsora pachyrhizi]|uniref:VWFA domain-containing protein n=1 Tax=Phakopsora pachyrhizi TaxID=170000 RepID=A0AAV0AKW9_PHAPC|nr:hypothetical protein BY996DRAFT_4582130 [Phakopsora pachyrhizi]CAH7668763.1 hypothetical protein PPACK8108_LOCUS3313 [Phakopsora pachyrhizi]
MLEKPGKDSDKPGKSLTNSYSKNSSDENESNSSSRKKSLSKKSSKRGAKDEILKISSTHNENLLATLKRFETMFLIDDSVSMARDRHWEMALEVVKSAIEAALPHVPDGIQLQFLNSSQNLVQAKSVDEVMNLLTSFKPNGASTPTETRLEYILNDYLQKIENEKEEKNIISKPLNIIIVTDGVADDLHNLITTIVKICKRLEAHNFPMSQVGIQFIQIGADRNVTKQLKFLDSKLEDNYGISRDIVDMIEYTGVITEKFNLKCLLGGVNKVSFSFVLFCRIIINVLILWV